TLRGNLRVSGFTRRAEVMPMAADRALRTLGRRGVRVDGIVADPPYGAGCVQRLVVQIAAGDVLGREGWLAVEHAVDETPAERPGLVPVASPRQGHTAITRLQRPEATASNGAPSTPAPPTRARTGTPRP